MGVRLSGSVHSLVENRVSSEYAELSIFLENISVSISAATLALTHEAVMDLRERNRSRISHPRAWKNFIEAPYVACRSSW